MGSGSSVTFSPRASSASASFAFSSSSSSSSQRVIGIRNGDIAFQLGNYLEAIVWYSISLSIENSVDDNNEDNNGDNSQNHKNHKQQQLKLLLSNRSKAYYMNGQYHFALNDAQRVIELDPRCSSGYFLAAKACEALHRLSHAYQHYERAKALSEDGNKLLSSDEALLSRIQSEVKLSQSSVYTWGLGESCGLGHSDLRDKYLPTMVEKLRGKHLLDISCGAMHTVAVTGTGEVYSWGQNKFGQVGIITNSSNDNLQFIIPQLIPTLLGIYISAVSCGAGHTIVISNDGRVFSWGLGGLGQLGHGNLENLPIPKQIKYLESYHIMAISCGIAHSIFLIERETTGSNDQNDNYLMGCGMNTYGALGFDSNTAPVCIPSEIPLPSSSIKCITHISSGGSHTAIVDDKGNIYLTGSNTCGQLGLNDNQIDFISKFTQITMVHTSRRQPLSPPHFVYVSCGEEFTMAITSNRQVYATGLGIAGQMGNGSQDNNSIFTHIESLDSHHIEEICCSQGIIYAISSTGAVWSWGLPKDEIMKKSMGAIESNTTKEEGLHSSLVPQPYLPLKKRNKAIRMIRCGRKHYTAITIISYGPTSYLRNVAIEDTIVHSIGKKLKFILQCCDILGQQVTSCGCIVVGYLIYMDTLQNSSISSDHSCPQEKYTENDISLHIDDNFDGSFSIETVGKIIKSGDYQLNLTIDDLHIHGSPFNIIVNPGLVSTISCKFQSSQHSSPPKFKPNEIISLLLEFSDQYGNLFPNFGNNNHNNNCDLLLKVVDDTSSHLILEKNFTFPKNKLETEQFISITFPGYTIKGLYSCTIEMTIDGIDEEESVIQSNTLSFHIQDSFPSFEHCKVTYPSFLSVDQEIVVKLQWKDDDDIDDDVNVNDNETAVITYPDIYTTITPQQHNLSARALIQLYTWNQDPCKPVVGVLVKKKEKGKENEKEAKDSSSSSEISQFFTYKVHISGKANLQIFIEGRNVYNEVIYISSGQINSNFTELLQPRKVLKEWNKNENEIERVLSFQLRDQYGNVCDVPHDDYEFFAEEWIDQNKETTKIHLLIHDLSNSLIEVRSHVINSNYISEYWIDVGMINRDNNERQQFQYSPYCLGSKEEQEQEQQDQDQEEEGEGKMDPLLNQITLLNSQNFNKLQKLEQTKKRANEILKSKQRMIREEKERKRRKQAVRRTGGGFVVQYSQEI